MNLILGNMTINILRYHQPLLPSLRSVSSNFGFCISRRTSIKKGCCHQFIHSACATKRETDQSIFRTFIHSSSVPLNLIKKSIETPNENQSAPGSTRPTDWPEVKKGREFEENEVNFFHGVLEGSSDYSGTVYQDDPQFFKTYELSDIEFERIVICKNWLEKPLPETIKSFASLGLYASKNQNITIEDDQFQSLIFALVQNLGLSSDQQLIDCFIALNYWPLLHVLKNSNFRELWKALDDVCLARNLGWTIDKCLFMMDLWYHLGLLRNSYFVTKALIRVSRKTEDFTAAQMVQSLFYISCKRKIPASIALREYEHYIQKYITKLSFEEIGIFAAAFFRTQTSILNKKLLMYMMQRTVEEAETAHSIVLASVAKVLRLSHKPEFGFTANDMVSKLLENSKWDSFSLVCGIHIVHIGTQIQFFNEESITKIVEKFCKDPSVARLKDMERIAFFLSLYNLIPPSTPDICNLIVEQLNLPLRDKEAVDHPLINLSLLYFLSLLRVYPEKQIRQALNEENLLKRYDKFTVPRQVVQLDYNRVMEGPPGSDHLLSPKLREYLARRHAMYIPDERYPVKSEFDKVMYEVMKASDQLLGNENNLVAYTLPHFPRPDILFRLDDSGKPLPIPEEMKSFPQFENVHRPVGPGKWCCVMIGGRNMYMHNVPRLVGEQAAKLRQLQALGYTTILIPSHYWRSEENKMAYLKLKYFFDYEKNK